MYHYSLTAGNGGLGFLMNTVTPLNNAVPPVSDCHVIGVAIGSANSLYIGRDWDAEIRGVNKATGVFVSTFATTAGRVEDLVCDPVTYAPKEAILAKDAFNSLYEAFEVETGTCPLPPKIEKHWTETNVCFERDTVEPSECPGGTSLGTPLPLVGGNYQVQAVTKGGKVSSYNPGQMYAVSTVTVAGFTPTLTITETYTDCVNDNPAILALNPTTGGGRLVVVEEIGGVPVQTHDANSPEVSFSGSVATVTLSNVAAGSVIPVYVKFGPGSKGQLMSLSQTCTNLNGASDGTTSVIASANLRVVDKP
ncbi:MAG: hypothetical protein EXR54_00455 [Dehalococcoidia bacterium]|nr:hypothetical protein [Dehalococcoidia bacterium]MSQ16032.1 hypothetical protein [Dehalococcoidia bacterium]